jgi:hypothetical protein
MFLLLFGSVLWVLQNTELIEKYRFIVSSYLAIPPGI